MKEYKISKGWAIFLYIMGPPFILLFCWLLVAPFIRKDFPIELAWIFVPASLGINTLIILGLVEALRTRVIFSDEKIIVKDATSTKQLLINEIKGYTIERNYYVVVPIDPKNKRIKISTYLNDLGEIRQWLSVHFENLDELIAQQERKDILNDSNYGWNEEIRKKRYRNSKKSALTINWIGGIIAAWCLFNPQPYSTAMAATIAMPLVALIATKITPLIHINDKKGSAYPSVVYGFFFPLMAVLLRALLDFNIFNYEQVWQYTFGIAIIIFLFFLIGQQEFKWNKIGGLFMIALMAVFFFLYSYGVIIHYNCNYDTSEPDYYTAQVLDKRVSSGKSTTYYLELTPWGPQEEIQEVKVSSKFYDQINTGEKVTILFKKGKLNIPWFNIIEN